MAPATYTLTSGRTSSGAAPSVSDALELLRRWLLLQGLLCVSTTQRLQAEPAHMEVCELASVWYPHCGLKLRVLFKQVADVTHKHTLQCSAWASSLPCNTCMCAG